MSPVEHLDLQVLSATVYILGKAVQHGRSLRHSGSPESPISCDAALSPLCCRAETVVFAHRLPHSAEKDKMSQVVFVFAQHTSGLQQALLQVRGGHPL